MSDTLTLKKEQSFFKRFFPSPTFLTMPAVGIDVSDESIKFLGLMSKNFNESSIVFGEERLESEVVVRGEIRDTDKLTKALSIIGEKMKTHFVRVSLPEQKAYFFTTQVPEDASHEQVLKLLEFKLEEHVPLSPKEAVVDYDRIPHLSISTHNHWDVGVTVYPKETIEKYTKVFSQAGLFPLSFEIEAQAIERSVVPSEYMGTCMIVDFGETSTGLSIISRGTLGFTSTLDIVGSDITSIIMEELGVKKDEVTKIKNTVGVVGSSEKITMTKQLLEKVDELAAEIKRHHTYWETRSKNEDGMKEKVERIILCGGNANIHGLPEYLEHALKIPVERANVWQNILSFDQVIPDMSYEVSLSYATAIGLAVRQIN